MNRYHLIVLFLLVAPNLFGHTGAKFSKEEVLADLKTLRESLVEAHYNVSAYTTEQELDSTCREIKNAVGNDSLSLLEATSLFQRLISAVNNGHTEIDFPGQAYIEYAYAGGTIFPLELAFEYGKALVRKNFSVNAGIRVGAEVLSINGVPVNEILQKISP